MSPALDTVAGRDWRNTPQFDVWTATGTNEAGTRDVPESTSPRDSLSSKHKRATRDNIYTLKAKKQAIVNKGQFSLDSMTSKLDEILDRHLPKFDRQPKRVGLKLPKLKKLGGGDESKLPKLKKTNKKPEIKLPKLKKVSV